MADSITCSPSALTGDTPCLSCLSESQLQAVLLYLLSLASDYELPGDLPTLLKDSACFTCMSKKEMLQAIVQVLATVNFESTNTADIQATAGCLLCANPQQVQAAITYLICKTNAMNSRILASGIVTLIAGSYIVNSAYASATNPILLSYYSVDNNTATLTYSNIIEGVAFQINSSNGADTNQVSWVILKP